MEESFLYGVVSTTPICLYRRRTRQKGRFRCSGLTCDVHDGLSSPCHFLLARRRRRMRRGHTGPLSKSTRLVAGVPRWSALPAITRRTLGDPGRAAEIFALTQGLPQADDGALTGATLQGPAGGLLVSRTVR